MTYAAETIYLTRDNMIDFLQGLAGDFFTTFTSFAFVFFFIGIIFGVLYKLIKD